MPPGDPVARALALAVRWRGPILVVYALLVPAAAFRAMHIPAEGAIDRLVVPSDPDYAATRDFQRVFPERQTALLLLESDDPWSAPSLARLAAARRALAGLPGVATFSPLDALRQARPGASPDALRRLALGTEFFRRQGLMGDRFQALVLSLEARDPAGRRAALAAVDERLASAEVGPVRKVGAPYVNDWLERQSGSAAARAFPVFGLLLVVVALYLYRSWRTLLALVLALAAAVALGVAAGGVMGFAFTIVSAVVPLTILVTALASLVYLQSRFVDQPADVALGPHQLAALRSKFLPVTASALAAAVGFAALAVSPIRPIRQMGLWTAAGLILSWLVCFTLFPALQLLLRTPTRQRVEVRGAGYDRLAAAIPGFTYRHRWALAGGALAVAAGGLLALLGVPGLWAGMRVGVDTLDYLGRSTPVYQDLRWFRDQGMDLNLARAWIHLPGPTATDPEVLRAVDGFQTALERLPDVSGVTGPTTPLRLRSYLAGKGEALPDDPAAFARAAADVEELLLTRGDLRAFIDVKGLSDQQLMILFRHGDAPGYAALARAVLDAWTSAQARSPALRGAELRVVGESLLQVKVGASLVPTLAQSFLITVALVFTAFLFLFRSGLERLLAMIPSLFALLATFLGMRLLGGALNVATILIATTVVGTTENDQIHFFHHMHEREGEGLEARLRHTLRVAGRAIVFATLINAAGFLGLALSPFPPLRQFGLMSSAAFTLALLADFTALPAALWIATRSRPARAPAPEPAPP